MSSEYIIIDKLIISEGKVFDFDLFTPSKSETSIEPFKQSGSLITIDDEKLSQNRKSLFYINEKDKLTYEEYYKTYLASLSNIEENTYVNMEDSSKKMYKNASKVMTQLFNGNITPTSYNDCKKVVSEFIGVMLDEEFSMKILNNSISHKYTISTHSLNVLMYALCIGLALDLKKEQLEELGEAALLFDIGKSKIEESILNKAEKLEPYEFTILKKHSEYGVSIAKQIGIENNNVLQAIKHHHEKIDGTGYPAKLKGNNIPKYARIIGLCDIFDALTTQRPYADAMSTFAALKYIKFDMGSQIDDELLKKLVLIFR